MKLHEYSPSPAVADRENADCTAVQTELDGSMPSNAHRLGKRSRAVFSLAWCCSSVVFLTIIFLALFEFGIRSLKPLHQIDVPGLTTAKQSGMLQKLIDALDSNQSPDVLLLGSSLVLNPSVRCDDQFAGRRTRYDGWYFAHVIQPYSKSDYFAALLASAARKKLITENLAIPGALVSDQRLILEKLLKNGKKPQIVFFFVEPRAFLDNTMPPEEKTPTAEVLSSYLNLKMLLNDPAAISHLPETVLGLVSNYYQERSDYRFFIVNLSSHMSGHPVGLFEAGVEGARKPTAVLPCLVAANKPSYEESANELRDLDVYKCRYLPVNWKRLQIQEKEFNELAHLTRDNHVQLVVVKMPITKENLSLLPQEAVTKYNTAIQKMSAAGVEVIDPSDKLKFDLSDYEDSVHLNGRGGAKLFRYIAETAALSLKQ